MLRFFLPLFFKIIFLCSFNYGAEFPQCDNESLGSFIAVASNCSKAIYCNGVDSVVLDCDKDSLYFSTEDKKCHNSTTVCGNRPFILVNIPTTIAPLSKPTIATSIGDYFSASDNLVSAFSSVATVSSETSTTELPTGSTTSNEQSLSTTSTAHQSGATLRESSTSSVSETTSVNLIATTEKNQVFVQCPGADDPSKPLFLPHPNSCSQYFLCYHGIATLMRCPNKLHFDETHQSCNTPEGAKCQLNYLIPREKCQTHTVNFYPHPGNCNYYYLCEYGFLMVMQCPFDMYWDYEQRVCTMRSMARCYNRNSI